MLSSDNHLLVSKQFYSVLTLSFVKNSQMTTKRVPILELWHIIQSISAQQWPGISTHPYEKYLERNQLQIAEFIQFIL